VPFSDQPPGATPDNTRVGNFYQDDSVANGYDDGYAVSGSTSYSSTQNYLTNVGAYASSASFYGTFDQGGNVWEWNDTVIGPSRGFRGGSWLFSEDDLRASNRNNHVPSNEDGDVGFRVASVAAVPEPSTAMFGIGLGLMWVLRRRRVSSF